MQELKLFPTKFALAKGVAIGAAFTLVGGFGFSENAGDVMSQTVFAIVTIVGFCVMVMSLKDMLLPRPSFTANAEGFRVRGKKQRPWSDYNGVTVQSVSTAFFLPSIKTLKFKVGSGLRRRTQHIKWQHMSGSAHDMGRQIETFASQAMGGQLTTQPAKREVTVPQFQMNAPSVPRAVTRPQADIALAQAMRSKSNGPVQSMPTLRERFMGRSTAY